MKYKFATMLTLGVAMMAPISASAAASRPKATSTVAPDGTVTRQTTQTIQTVSPTGVITTKDVVAVTVAPPAGAKEKTIETVVEVATPQQGGGYATETTTQVTTVVIPVTGPPVENEQPPSEPVADVKAEIVIVPPPAPLDTTVVNDAPLISP